MQLFNTRRKKVMSTFATCVIAGVAGLAFAAWLQDGEGPGAGKLAELEPPTVSAGTATGSACAPGGSCDGAFVIDNPNNTDLVIYGTAQPSVIDGGVSNPGCPFVASVLVNNQSGLNLTVPKNATTPVTVPDVFRLAESAPDACQGASFTRTARLRFQTPNGG